MGSNMRWGVVGFIGAMVAITTLARASAVSYTGGTLSEDFNGLYPFLYPDNELTNSVELNTQYAIPSTIGFVTEKLSGESGSNIIFDIYVERGTVRFGVVGSFGASDSDDRALGLMASETGVFTFGIDIVNNTTDVMKGFDLSITRQQWRSSTESTNTITFAYAAVDHTNTIPQFLSDSTLTHVSTFDLVGAAPVEESLSMDGNANAAVLTGRVIFPTPLEIGGHVYLRWTDTDDAGDDASLAIDDFTFKAVSAPEPSGLVFLVAAILPMIGRRRKRMAVIESASH